MISEHRGVQAIRKLLYVTYGPDGYTALSEECKLDSNDETHVLKLEFADLFTAEEQETACSVQAYGYEVLESASSQQERWET